MTRGDAPLRRAGAPCFPCDHLLCLQATETEGGEGGTAQYRLGYLFGSSAPRGLCHYRDLADAHGEEARTVGIGTNALASSIVLVCRQRPAEAPTVSRREFLRELNAVLPEALDEMTRGVGEDRSPVAPVDLSQAIIGPGMAVFSKYAAVLEADGSPMPVRSALQLINRFLAEDDFDPDTQFCLHWFQQNGWKEGRFGDAETLSRAKGTSVDGVKEAGVFASGGGVVRLLKWSEYPPTGTREPTREPRLGDPASPHPGVEAGWRDRRWAPARSRDGAKRVRPSAGLPSLHPLRAPRLGRRCSRIQRTHHELDGYRIRCWRRTDRNDAGKPLLMRGPRRP